MTRTAPSAVATLIATAGGFHLARLVHIALDDGTIIGLTDWDETLPVDLDGGGSVSYSPADLQALSAFAAKRNAPIDDAELMLIVDGATIVADDVRKGTWRAGVVTVGYVDPSDLANPWLHRVYDIGEAPLAGINLKLELLGPEKRLEQQIGRVLTQNCGLRFAGTACGVQTDVAAWAGDTVYVTRADRNDKVGAIVKPSSYNGFWYLAQIGGRSDNASPPVEPTWPVVLAGTVVDNEVTWQAIHARRATGTVATVTDKRTFTATGISIVADHWAEGLVIWLTGSNAGQVRRIKSDSGAGGLVTHLASFDTIAVSDTFTVITGCRKRRAEDCLGKFDNNERFFGFEHLAEEDVTATAKKG